MASSSTSARLQNKCCCGYGQEIKVKNTGKRGRRNMEVTEGFVSEPRRKLIQTSFSDNSCKSALLETPLALPCLAHANDFCLARLAERHQGAAARCGQRQTTISGSSKSNLRHAVMLLEKNTKRRSNPCAAHPQASLGRLIFAVVAAVFSCGNSCSSRRQTRKDKKKTRRMFTDGIN